MIICRKERNEDIEMRCKDLLIAIFWFRKDMLTKIKYPLLRVFYFMN